MGHKLHEQTIEIFAKGIWNDSRFTESDIDKLVEDTNASIHLLHPPLKLGHDGKQKLVKDSGMPSIGWIASVSKHGDKILAHVKGIPEQIHSLLGKAYRRVSVELFRDWRNPENGKLMSVIKGLALLGADLPAVTTLKDVAALYGEKFSNSSTVDECEIVIFEMEASVAKEQNFAGPYTIEQREDKFVVLDGEGNSMGAFDTEDEARAKIEQLIAEEEAGKEGDEAPAGDSAPATENASQAGSPKTTQVTIKHAANMAELQGQVSELKAVINENKRREVARLRNDTARRAKETLEFALSAENRRIYPMQKDALANLLASASEVHVEQFSANEGQPTILDQVVDFVHSCPNLGQSLLNEKAYSMVGADGAGSTMTQAELETKALAMAEQDKAEGKPYNFEAHLKSLSTKHAIIKG